MKITPSLKIYFMLAMLLLSLVMVTSFSALTLNYFGQGLDRGVGFSMREAGEIEGVEKSKPGHVFGYQIAAVWSDLPENIKQAFDDKAPTESYRLDKKMVGFNVFGPPEEMYLILKVLNKAGQVRYVAKYINKGEKPPESKEHSVIPHFVWVIVFAIAAIGFFLLAVFFIIRKVAKPIESLKDWAKSLDEAKLKQPIPDFQYSELNTLAAIINSSLNSVQESLDRELLFLSYASHELRTPISVVRANTELLKKLQEKEGGSDKQSEVLERVDRAGKTMTNLTDTLLWLSRDDTNMPDSEKLDIGGLIEQLVDELSYLLDKKPIHLAIKNKAYIIDAAAIPCRIVLANLIRNAFQHSMEGDICIEQQKGQISIVNLNKDTVINCADLGFGLGLQLTKKLAYRYGWSYHNKVEDGCYHVNISF